MAGARGVLLSILDMQQAYNILAFTNVDRINYYSPLKSLLSQRTSASTGK